MKKSFNSTTYSKLKSRKLFSVYDLLIYAVISLLIVVLFCAFIIFSNNPAQIGFKCVRAGKTLFTYEYSQTNDKLTILDGNSEIILHKKDTNEIVVYFNQQRTDYNVIKYDNQTKSVNISQSTCSISKDCVYMPSITTSGSIICAPHNLKVVPLGNADLPIITG